MPIVRIIIGHLTSAENGEYKILFNACFIAILKYQSSVYVKSTQKVCKGINEENGVGQIKLRN